VNRGRIIHRIGQAALAAVLAALMATACGDPNGSTAVDPPERKKLTEITGSDDFERIVSTAGSRLLLIEFYADWCAPCKELEPVLERLAWEERDRADFYKINLDANRPLAEFFRLRAIPYVALVKNRTIVYSLMGLREADAYRSAIRSFAGDGGGGPQLKPEVVSKPQIRSEDTARADEKSVAPRRASHFL
jgi:thioredoxin 1